VRVLKIWSVVVNSVDVTDAIASSIISLNYTDVFSSGASLIDFEVASDSPFMPVINQFIEIKFGYLDSPGFFVNTGTMRIDNVVQGFRPDTVKLGAIAWEAGQEAFNEGFSYGYQNFNLAAAIANSATVLGLTVSPLPNPLPNNLIIGTTPTLSASSSNTVSITSLRGRYRLLDDIATQYGYLFQAKGGILFFRRLTDVRALPAIATIPLSACQPGSTFRRNQAGVVRQVDITTRSGTTTTYTDALVPASIQTRVKIPDYFENLGATAARAAGFFAERNEGMLTGRISFAGSVIYSSGQSVTLSGFTAPYNGKWLITQVNHTYGASGYTTELSLA